MGSSSPVEALAGALIAAVRRAIIGVCSRSTGLDSFLFHRSSGTRSRHQQRMLPQPVERGLLCDWTARARSGAAERFGSQGSISSYCAIHPAEVRGRILQHLHCGSGVIRLAPFLRLSLGQTRPCVGPRDFIAQ